MFEKRTTAINENIWTIFFIPICISICANINFWHWRFVELTITSSTLYEAARMEWKTFLMEFCIYSRGEIEELFKGLIGLCQWLEQKNFCYRIDILKISMLLTVWPIKFTAAMTPFSHLAHTINIIILVSVITFSWPFSLIFFVVSMRNWCRVYFLMYRSIETLYFIGHKLLFHLNLNKICDPIENGSSKGKF